MVLLTIMALTRVSPTTSKPLGVTASAGAAARQRASRDCGSMVLGMVTVEMVKAHSHDYKIWPGPPAPVPFWDITRAVLRELG